MINIATSSIKAKEKITFNACNNVCTLPAVAGHHAYRMCVCVERKKDQEQKKKEHLKKEQLFL